MDTYPRSLSPRRLPAVAFCLAMTAGWLGILVMSSQYFRDVPHPFIVEKLPLPHEAAWRFVLKAHVVAALFSLPACLVQLSAKFRARFLRVHRWLGRVTAMVVLLVLVPSGFILALTARGGLAGTLGFMLSGIIVLIAILGAVARARAGDHAGHRRAARHVVAQLSVAVTSRAMLVGLGFLGMHGDGPYLLALWIPVLGSAAVVELMEARARPAAVPQWARLSLAGVAGAVLAVPAVLIVPSTMMVASGSSVGRAQAQVTQGLVEPLVRWRKKRASFSRIPTPMDYRARFPEEPPRRDSSGATFVRFSLDARYGSEKAATWHAAAITGCVYSDTGAIYVEAPSRGGDYRDASSLFGRRWKPAPEGACVSE